MLIEFVLIEDVNQGIAVLSFMASSWNLWPSHLVLLDVKQLCQEDFDIKFNLLMSIKLGLT